MRVVSLLASGTEIVCALGAGETLVGRSHECDWPEWVRKLPCCSEAAFDINMSSRAIDAEVRRRLKAKEPLYRVDVNKIMELKPDLVIAQSHCPLCAVTPKDVQRAGCSTIGAFVLAIEVGNMAGIYQGIQNVAKAMDLTARGQE